jgi:hypothetical protein
MTQIARSREGFVKKVLLLSRERGLGLISGPGVSEAQNNHFPRALVL